VASQQLLASLVARPLIEALDYAQRTNTIGSLRQSDVSRTITAPAVLAQSQTPTVIVQENKALREILRKPNAEASSLGLLRRSQYSTCLKSWLT